MGILQRFSDIMSANINSLLSGAEEKNAGKLLEKYLADARANLEELKSETSGRYTGYNNFRYYCG